MDGCYSEYLSENINTQFIFEPVTRDQITNIVNSFKNSSPGMDDLPIKLFKENLSVLANIIAYICNLSIETGVFPKQLMTSIVSSCLHNTGDPHLFDNYRAISILVAFSKILEKIVIVQLVEYFVVNNLFTERQFGYRSNVRKVMRYCVLLIFSVRVI